MAAEPLRIGLIGPGGIGKVHMDAIRRIPEALLIAVAASTPEKARRISEEMWIPFTYGDYHQLLENDEVEVVHVCTRNRSHYPIVRDTLAANKHVVCEKPLGINSTETAEMVRLAAASGVIDAVCYNHRFYPLMHHLRAMIRQDELGEVHTVHGSYLQDWLFLETAYDWRVDPEEGGTLRVVGDIGTHWLDLVYFLTGLQVSSVSADLGTVVPERLKAMTSSRGNESVRRTKVVVETEDYAAILIDFEGRARGNLVVSQVAAGHKNRLAFEINGTRASAAWDSERPNELWVGYREERNHLMISETSLLDPTARAIICHGGGHTHGVLDPFFQLFRAIYGEIQKQGDPSRNQEPAFARFADGHRDVSTVGAILASHQRRRWVEVQL